MIKTSKKFTIICNDCNSNLIKIGVTAVQYGMVCGIIIVCLDCGTVEDITGKVMSLSKNTFEAFIKGVKVKR